MSPALSVPEGYKMTEVGIIPGDWLVTTVGDEFSIQLGKMLDEEKNTGTYKPFLGNRSVQWSWIDISGIGEIKLTSTDIQKFRLRRGDLLVCEGGEVGRSAIWKDELEECYFQKALHRLRPKRFYNVPLMSHLLQWLADTGGLQNFVTQTSIAHLPKDKFETVPIPLLEKAEQQAIAEALSDADALVESLAQLLVKKRQIKQGAMQELLTGQKRLPGFSGEWELKRLGDIAEMNSGGTPPSSNPGYYDGSVPWVSIADMTKGGKYIDSTEKNLSSLGFENCAAQMFSTGTILYAMYASLGECSIANIALSSSQAILGIRSKSNLNNEFLYYFLQSIKPQVKGMGQQGTQANLNKGMVQDFRLRLPLLPEQTAIATVLSNMDSDIAALQSQLVKARQIKQGMAQELLTGRIRLVSPAITNQRASA